MLQLRIAKPTFQARHSIRAQTGHILFEEEEETWSKTPVLPAGGGSQRSAI